MTANEKQKRISTRELGSPSRYLILEYLGASA